MFDDFSIGNSVSFGDFLKLFTQNLPFRTHHHSPYIRPTKKHGAFGTPAMMVKPNASERVKIKRLKCWMKYWTLACIKPKWQNTTEHPCQLMGILWQQKIMPNKLWDHMGSMDAYCTISGCLFLHICTPFEFDQGATLMTNTKPGRKSPHPLLSGNSAFVSFMRKNSCRFQKVSSFMVSSHETSWKWAIHTLPSIYRIIQNHHSYKHHCKTNNHPQWIRNRWLKPRTLCNSKS